MLFTEWGEYYSEVFRWREKQWMYFAGFISVVMVAAYLDEPVRYLFFTIHGHLEDRIAGYVHWYGTGHATLYAFLLVYICGAVFASWKWRVRGMMILQSYLYSGVITIALKSIVGRWRPYTGRGHLMFSPMITGPNAHLSFPTGDAAVAFALSIVLAGYSRNIAWKIFWILVAVLTSLSRIYYDVHWFSDVVFSTVNATVAAAWLVRRYGRKAGAAA